MARRRRKSRLMTKKERANFRKNYLRFWRQPSVSVSVEFLCADMAKRREITKSLNKLARKHGLRPQGSGSWLAVEICDAQYGRKGLQVAEYITAFVNEARRLVRSHDCEVHVAGTVRG